MNAAVLDLVYLSLRGRVLRRSRLLRQPRHLVAFAAGLAYFGFIFLRPLLRNRSGPRLIVAEWLEDPLRRSAAHLALALGLAAAVTLIWLLASSKPSLSLSEAEAHLLLPAPLSRREVLQYLLLKQQPGLLFSALVLTLFSGAGPPPARLARFAVTWALLTLVDLHLKGVNLWKATWRERPLRRTVLAGGLALAAGLGWWTAVGLALAGAWRVATAAGTAEGTLLLAAMRAGPLDELLAPFLWLSAPLFGSGAWPRIAGVLVLAGLLAANYEWVLSSRARFEEAAVERARREMARRARRPRFEGLAPTARRRVPFALAPTGTPEAAIYWKNLLLRGRMPWARVLAGGAAGLVLLAAGLTAVLALGAFPAGAVVGVVGGAGLALLVGGPPAAGLFFRNDLRVDLLEVEILRPWPIAGSRLVAAEVLAAATSGVLVSLVGAGLIVAATAAIALAGATDADFVLLPSWAQAGAGPGGALVLALASLLLAGAPVALVSVAIQNVAVLLFPGWVSLGLDRRKGAAAVGQGVLSGIAHLLALATGAVPAAIGVGAVVLVLHGLLKLPFTAWELPPLALLVGGVFLLEAWLLVRLGGTLWDRLDPSQELLDAPRDTAS